MNEVACPACAGPDNAECATCNGNSFVSQEVHDLFVEEKLKQDLNMQLKKALQELPFENTPGMENTATIVAAAKDSIRAIVDSKEVVWSESTQSWV